jgi:hypothetical protein
VKVFWREALREGFLAGGVERRFSGVRRRVKVFWRQEPDQTMMGSGEESGGRRAFLRHVRLSALSLSSRVGRNESSQRTASSHNQMPYRYTAKAVAKYKSLIDAGMGTRR